MLALAQQASCRRGGGDDDEEEEDEGGSRLTQRPLTTARIPHISKREVRMESDLEQVGFTRSVFPRNFAFVPLARLANHVELRGWEDMGAWVENCYAVGT